MTFEELCKDFNNRKPNGERLGLIPWFNIKLENIRENQSANDILRSYLKEQEYQYINDFSGNVWFLANGIGSPWTRTEIEVRDGIIHYYWCKFDN